MKRHVLLLGIIVMIALPMSNVFAQTIATKLDAVLKKTLDSMQKVHKSKALSAAMYFKDGSTWSYAKGYSSEVPYVIAKNDQAYLIGSVVKTITSACILQLADEKKLNIDDPLSKWLDSLPHISPKITLRQLMQHQSGLYDVLSHPQNQSTLLANKDSLWSYKNLIIKFIKAPLAAPGGTYNYCNTNYFLLAMVIEKITGNPYYSEYRKRFFTPLSLNSFKIPAYEGLPKNVAHVWIDLNGDGILDDAHNFYTKWNSLNSVAGSAGGYYALPEDVAKWIYKYMRGDLLSPAMMAEAKKIIPAPGTQGGNYGLGLMDRVILNQKAIGHGGDLSYSASSWYLPSKDVSVSVHCNDSKYISWTMLPTVTELLRTYIKNESFALNSNELSASIGFKVMPNPSFGEATIRLQLPEALPNAKINITDSFGRIVGEWQENDLQNGENIINIDEKINLPKGLYFISLKVNDKILKTEKMVIG